MTKRDLASCAADASVPAGPRMNDPEVAQPIWDRLIRARRESPIVSIAEDAVFRFYLPLARSLARSSTIPDADRDRAEQAAELGLARAVLAWREHDCTAFVSFARAVILRQLQAIAASAAPRRRLPQR